LINGISQKDTKAFRSLHESQAVGFLHGAKRKTLSGFILFARLEG